MGVDARLLGAPGDALRLGVGAALFLPNGSRHEYVTDGTFRAALRLLGAGDVGAWRWAATAGAHLRPLDDGAPGSPRGSEFLFSAAAGRSFGLADGAWRLAVGPEVLGATAPRTFLAPEATALEALGSARLEEARVGAVQLRVRLGAGVGLNAAFGAPQARVVLGLEWFGAANTAGADQPRER